MASKLLTHGTILTFNSDISSISVIHDSHLLITGDTIAQISSDLSSINQPPDTEVIDCSGKIISPGFIDTHRHVWQTAFRTLGPNVTLAEYFFKYSMFGSAKEAFTADDIYISTLAGYCDALNTGVTTLIDHAHNVWRKDVMNAGLRAATDGGARVWWCFDPTIVSSEGWGYDEQAAELKAAVSTLRSSRPDSLVQIGLAFDGLDQADQERITNIKTLIQNLDANVMTVHYLGGPWPAADNSPSLADKHGFLDLSTAVVFSHAGYIPPTDIELLRKKNHFLSITPESEMHYGHGQVTSRNVQDHASLGVDTAWTYSGDLLTQARLWLQSNRLQRYERVLDQGKIPRENPMTAEQAFLLATRQGGLALRRDDVGVLRVGAKADLVIFDTQSPNMVGWRDAVAAVVLHANVGDIEGVLVGGQWRKKDGQLVGDFGGRKWKDVRASFEQTAKKVQEAGSQQEAPQLENFLGTEFGDVEKVAL